MSYYYQINGKDPKEKRIAKRLIRLKEGFKNTHIPESSINDNLLIATWNIRDFDTDAYGRRDKESIAYIAEIISRFDLVAVQEVKDDLTALDDVMKLLGGWWKCIMTDATEGSGGNRERMAFVFNTKKVVFGGLAGEVVIPPIETSRGKFLEPSKQLYRTPFIAGFKAGWFKFMICTAHIMYGKSKANDPDREAEIAALAKFLANRAQNKFAWANNMILLGDFNIFKPKDVTMKAITDAGFYVPPQLQKLPSNALRNKHYDQIAFLAPDIQAHIDQSNAGVFNFYNYVYRNDDREIYIPEMGKAYDKNSKGVPRTERSKSLYYNSYWRTQQMSDHLPMWIELKTDFGLDYLKSQAES